MLKKNKFPTKVQNLLEKNHQEQEPIYSFETAYDMYADDASMYAFVFEESLVIIWQPQGYEYIYLQLLPDEVKSLKIIEGEILDKLEIVSHHRSFSIWVDKRYAENLDLYSKYWIDKHTDIPFLKTISTEFKIQSIDELTCHDLPNTVIFGAVLIYFIRYDVEDISEIYRSFIESHLSNEDILMASLKIIDKFEITDFYEPIKRNFSQKQIETLLTNLCDIMTKEGVVNQNKEKLLYEVTSAIGGDLEFIKLMKGICFRKNHFPHDS